MDENQTQRENSGLVPHSNNGMGATVTFPFLENTGAGLSDYTTWLEKIGQYVTENPLIAFGVGIGLILMASMAGDVRIRRR